MNLYVCNNNLERIADIGLPEACRRAESINADNTLTFTTAMRNPAAKAIKPDSVMELEGDYFDVAALEKQQGHDGQRRITAECEHVSYRLNDPAYNVEYFVVSGDAFGILAKILSGSEFTAERVDFDKVASFSLQEAVSRRGLLVQFAEYVGGELLFNGFTVSILAQRGRSVPTPIQSGKDIKIISERVDKRRLTEGGMPTVSYTCEVQNPDRLELGDAVRLLYPGMAIDADLRVMTKNYDPFNRRSGSIALGNNLSMLESDVYRIEAGSVAKDKVYNGARIGPEYGFENILSNKLARSYFRADQFAMQIGDGSGDNWFNKLWVETYPEEDRAELFFDGKLTVDAIEALSSVITPYIYADDGMIVNAVVRRLRTDLSKPRRYLLNDTSDVHYQDIGDTDIVSGRYFKVSQYDPASPAVQYSIPSLDGTEGVLLWWYDGVASVDGAMTTNPKYAIPAGGTEPEPVMTYAYKDIVVHKEELRQTAQGWWGVRHQFGSGINTSGRGAGLLEKTDQHWQMVMDAGNGEEIGGVRISAEDGVQLYNRETGVWEYPNGGGGSGGGVANFDALHITDRGFTITQNQEDYTFTTPKDALGRIISVNGGGKERVISYG